MSFKVQEFPFFNHYLVSILLRVDLAERSFFHVLSTVSDYSVLDYCRCEDPLCSTVTMSSPSLIDKDVTYCNAFNIGWVNINFFPDGQMEIESLADKEECNFPFRQKIRDVFAEKGVGYDNTYAEEVVGSFVKELETTEVKRVDV